MNPANICTLKEGKTFSKVVDKAVYWQPVFGMDIVMTFSKASFAFVYISCWAELDQHSAPSMTALSFVPILASLMGSSSLGKEFKGYKVYKKISNSKIGIYLGAPSPSPRSYCNGICPYSIPVP